MQKHCSEFSMTPRPLEISSKGFRPKVGASFELEQFLFAEETRTALGLLESCWASLIKELATRNHAFGDWFPQCWSVFQRVIGFGSKKQLSCISPRNQRSSSAGSLVSFWDQSIAVGRRRTVLAKVSI